MKTTLIKVRVRGFSLVELMIAVTLGLLLTAVMIQLFSGTRITFATIDAQARVQESGRFALETLKRELREAGTHGFCAAQLNIRNHLNDDETMDDILDFGRAVVGWEYGSTGRNQTFELPVDLTPPSSGPWTATDIGGLPAAIRGVSFLGRMCFCCAGWSRPPVSRQQRTTATKAAPCRWRSIRA